ncbi:MAG: YcaO-like family protein [Candidatus Daviesbacteria bacterium]|nr:YcaO-like family protein [Candidatus Daviesbacteria bacterium]
MNINGFFQRISRFVLNNPKIVKSFYKTPNYNDEPQLYQYSSQFIDGNSLRVSMDSIASGTSFDKNSALLKLLGETVERYSLSIYDNSKLIYRSFRELVCKNKNALNPTGLALLPQFFKENKKEALYDIKFYWVIGKSLVTNKNILVPAQLIFVPYSHSKSEPILQTPISTGAAAGEAIYDALYRGICEVIERDSFMIHYYNKISSPRINPYSLRSKKISKIIRIFERYNLELCVNDITTDIGVPAVIATVIDKTGLGPAICVGLKAGFDMNQNVIGATEETLMVRSWIRDEYMYLKPKHSSPRIISTIEERANFWCPTSTIHYLDFWLSTRNNGGSYKLCKFRRSSYKEKVMELIRILKSKGLDIIYIDITAPEIRKYNVKVVKVIIPQLQPVHLDERYPYLTFQRLYNAPVNMGILGRPKTFEELNSIPHPFL